MQALYGKVQIRTILYIKYLRIVGQNKGQQVQRNIGIKSSADKSHQEVLLFSIVFFLFLLCFFFIINIVDP